MGQGSLTHDTSPQHADHERKAIGERPLPYLQGKAVRNRTIHEEMVERDFLQRKMQTGEMLA